MKKFVKDLMVRAVERVHQRYVLIRLTDGELGCRVEERKENEHG